MNIVHKGFAVIAVCSVIGLCSAPGRADDKNNLKHATAHLNRSLKKSSKSANRDLHRASKSANRNMKRNSKRSRRSVLRFARYAASNGSTPAMKSPASGRMISLKKNRSFVRMVIVRGSPVLRR